MTTLGEMLLSILSEVPLGRPNSSQVLKILADVDDKPQGTRLLLDPSAGSNVSAANAIRIKLKAVVVQQRPLLPRLNQA